MYTSNFSIYMLIKWAQNISCFHFQYHMYTANISLSIFVVYTQNWIDRKYPILTHPPNTCTPQTSAFMCSLNRPKVLSSLTSFSYMYSSNIILNMLIERTQNIPYYHFLLTQIHIRYQISACRCPFNRHKIFPTFTFWHMHIWNISLYMLIEYFHFLLTRVHLRYQPLYASLAGGKYFLLSLSIVFTRHISKATGSLNIRKIFSTFTFS